MTTARLGGLAFVFLWFLLGGIGHFASTAFFLGIIPPLVPFPLTVIYVSGVLELLGAAGLLLAATRRAAGIGLFALTIAVTPANIHMWLNPAQFSEVHLGGLTLHPTPAALGWRLVIQIGLLACIALSCIRRPAPGK